MEWIKNPEHLEQVQEKNKELAALLFYGNFSPAAKRALNELEQFSRENSEIPVYIVDVEKVKGVHKKLGVKHVPTVVALQQSNVTQKIEGVQSAQFYARVFAGVQAPHHKPGEAPIHKVTVYSTPTCPACSRAKSYLRRRGIRFRDIDVSRDQRAAEALAKRSGQMAVPQIDIDGHLIVGFDQVNIEQLLSN